MLYNTTFVLLKLQLRYPHLLNSIMLFSRSVFDSTPGSLHMVRLFTKMSAAFCRATFDFGRTEISAGFFMLATALLLEWILELPKLRSPASWLDMVNSLMLRSMNLPRRFV